MYLLWGYRRREKEMEKNTWRKKCHHGGTKNKQQTGKGRVTQPKNY